MSIFRTSNSPCLKQLSQCLMCCCVRLKSESSEPKAPSKEKGPEVKSCEWDWASCKTEIRVRKCHEDFCSIGKSVKQPCVVIIGGGIAGLSAAARLVQCGITNFIVLEATERPGGRLKSCWLGDSVVELGAQYIHGACIANKVFTLAALEQLVKYPLDRINYHNSVFLTSSGKSISKDIVQKGVEIYYNIISKAADLFLCNETTPHASLAGYYDDSVTKSLRDVDENDKSEVNNVLSALKNNLRSRLGADLNSISSSSFGSYRQLPGGDIVVKNGLAGVLAPLLKPLHNCAISYCKTVSTIKWGTAGNSLSPRAVVVTDDTEEFPADYVIVTVSLGVLKVMSDYMFCPGLPANKMDAIKNLGFGNVNKLFLLYDKPFWSPTSGNFDLAWTAQEQSDRTDWTKGISSFTPVFGSKNVLQTNISGPEAKAFEFCTDEVVAYSITELIRKFTGDPSIPEPDEIVRSCWSTDPYFYGAYTYMGIDAHNGYIQNLSEPLPDNCLGEVPPIIFFAGEHTSPKHYSTIHGARESGIREADRIISLTKRLGGPPNGDPSCPDCTTKRK